MIRIGVVNDSKLAVESMTRTLETAGDKYTVIWTAYDGVEALGKCMKNKPDLVLMDLVMPGIDGAETTAEIMQNCATAILVVTASVEGNSTLAFRAMGEGALDVIATPSLGNSAGQEAFLKKIRQIGILIQKPEYHPRQLLSDTESKKIVSETSSGNRVQNLVAIGCSAGGPAAIAEILKNLHEPDCAIVIVQHIDSFFVSELAKWLDSVSQCPVRIAVEGEKPENGTALLSDTSGHLEITAEGTLSYNYGYRNLSFRPSVDIFLKSAALNWKSNALGIILSGMGKDGAEGLLSMKKRGFMTIAQNRSTSAIYGMPGAAVELNAANEILPLSSIGLRILEWIRQNSA